MATKKTEEVKEEAKTEEVKAEKKEKTVTVHLPRERGNNAPQFVGTSTGVYMVQRGVDVEVPEAVANVLMLREKALDDMYAYEEKLKENKGH
jgi:hypothetical protein